MSKRDDPSRNPAPAGAPGPSHVVVSRAWLWTFVALILVPWLAAAWIYQRRSATTSAEQATTEAAPSTDGATALRSEGPWGQLEATPIVISPPLEYIPEDHEAPPERAAWILPGARPADLARLLQDAGVGSPLREEILASAREEPGVGGVAAYPENRLVAALAQPARERLYRALAAFPQNERQQNAFRFHGDADAWLGTAAIRPETRALVRPLLYEHEGFLQFADIDLVRGRLADRAEVRRLTKVLFREATLLVKLRIPRRDAVDGLAEYWGRGGRRVDLRPVLESVAAAGPGFPLDIIHLLPAFARERLYRYPRISLADLRRPGLENCFWTALNFFSEKPDERLLDVRAALAALERDYYFVHDSPQFGDVVAFAAEDGSYYHAAVHVADGIVFGKNGLSTLAPWTLLPVERIRGYYPQHAKGQVTYFRRKGL